MSIARTAGVALGAASGIVATAVSAVGGRWGWPAGVNEWTSAAGSGIPVVLVPGSFVPGEFYWHRLAPALIAEGHRVFACNLPGLGTREPAVLVEALDRFVTEVRRATGSDRVVLVGQSFGGVIIRDLLRSTSADVAAAVLVSAQNHGFRRPWATLFSAPIVRRLVSVVCPMALRLIPGSAYLASLDASSAGAVPITTITSSRDAFASADSVAVAAASNVVLQDVDPGIRSGHMLIGYDETAVKLVVAAVAQGTYDGTVHNSA